MRLVWQERAILPATAAAAAPGLLVLAVLAAASVLDWGYALAGGMVVLAGGIVAAIAAAKTGGTP